LVPTRIEAQHFGNAKIVCVAARDVHLIAVTEDGTVYTWGTEKLVPTTVTQHLLKGARVGRCHDLPPMHALTLAMGTQARLGSAGPMAVPTGGRSQRRSQRQQGKAPAAADTGNGKDCEYFTMPDDLARQVVRTCVSWPEGQAGELERVVRLLGVGMMQARGST